MSKFYYPFRYNQLKVMNDSITSAEENQKRPISLFHEINTINTDDWRNQEFQFSPHGSFHQSFDRSREDNSFCNELPLDSKICETILQAQDAFEMNIELPIQQKTQSQKQENKSQQPPSSISSNSNVPSQVTITLHQQSLASKFYEECQTEDDSNFSTSLRSFLSLNDKNYRPHLICMKFLFSKLKEHSKQSLQTLKLYIHFFEIKIKQQTRSLRPFEKLELQIKQKQEADEDDDVNIDEKVLIDHMKKENLQRQTARRDFYHQTKEIHEELLSLWRKIKQKREKRERFIQQEIIRVIDRIQLEMQDMIKCRLLNEKQKSENMFTSTMIRSRSPYLTKDKYLEMKYLIQRENAYLKLITDLNGKIITYMISMFSKQQVQIHKNIKDALTDYSHAYMNCYDENNEILGLKISKAEDMDCERELKLELSNLLLSFIPKELYDINQNRSKFKNSDDKLEAILGDFSSSLQNTIFLSTIQMNNEFIIFRNEAIWRTNNSFFEKEENCIDYESKQALANSKTINANLPELQTRCDMKIVVVLTSNYYLHLENEDKIATVKLGEVKLSKRGREVILSDKGKGIGGYFGIKTELGRLEFETTEEVDIFAQKLSLALRRLTYS